MLCAPFRGYIIKVKKKLQKAIEAGKRLSDIAGAIKETATKFPKTDNLMHPNSRFIGDIGEYIKEHHHNPGREVMVNSASKIGTAEYEHDIYYAWFMDYYATKIAIEMIEDRWKPRSYKFPIPEHWDGEDIPDIRSYKWRQ